MAELLGRLGKFTRRFRDPNVPREPDPVPEAPSPMPVYPEIPQQEVGRAEDFVRKFLPLKNQLTQLDCLISCTSTAAIVSPTGHELNRVRLRLPRVMEYQVRQILKHAGIALPGQAHFAASHAATIAEFEEMNLMNEQAYLREAIYMTLILFEGSGLTSEQMFALQN